ncbi:hypothetical protein RclHR1_18680002 [Rhizophagus clarus]|uniref:G domain-containing protein n=1 Tax=Rhizophagus clarus TaxID=94130 RepID=A0A2Z6QS06_9GLOM|nr:hypothetical protein RclHR1_18680002 [Rhizophagus clarus]
MHYCVAHFDFRQKASRILVLNMLRKNPQKWFDKSYFKEKEEIIDIRKEDIRNIVGGSSNLHGSLKIEDFTKLKSIVLKKLSLTSLEIINCPQLTRVDLSEFIKLESLFVSKCPRLTKLDLSHSQLYELTDLDVSNLIELNCSNTSIEELSLNLCPNIIKVICSNNKKLINLDISNCFKLEFLDCSNCSNSKFTWLDLRNCPENIIIIKPPGLLLTRTKEKTKNILIIGCPDSGKSTLANVLTGTENFKESEYETSEIERFHKEVFEWKGTKYCVIDTKVSNRIAEAACSISGGISHFLLVIGKDFRDEINTLGLIGSDIFENTTIVRTKFSNFKSRVVCEKDKKKLCEESEINAKIVESCKGIIYIDNPPINIPSYDDDDDYDKEDIIRNNKKTREKSRAILLDHLEKVCKEEALLQFGTSNIWPVKPKENRKVKLIDVFDGKSHTIFEIFKCSTQHLIKRFKLNHGFVLNGYDIEPSIQEVIVEDGELKVNLYEGQPLVYTHVDYKNTGLDTCINFPVAEIIYNGNLLESFLKNTDDKNELHKLYGDFIARRFLAGGRLFIENFRITTTAQADILKFYLFCVYNSVKYSTEIQFSNLFPLNLLPKLVTSYGKNLNTHEDLVNWMNDLYQSKKVNCDLISYNDLILISQLKNNTSLVDGGLETFKEKQPEIANFKEKLSLEEWVGDAVNDNLMSWTRDFNLFRGLIINKNEKIEISKKIPIRIIKIPEVNPCVNSYLRIIKPSTKFELALISSNILPNENPDTFPSLESNVKNCTHLLVENDINGHELSTLPLIESNINNHELSTLPLVKSNVNNHELSTLSHDKNKFNSYEISAFPLGKSDDNNYEGYDHVLVKSEKYEIHLNIDSINPTGEFEQAIEEALNSMKPLKALQGVFNEYGLLFSQRIFLGGSLRNILPNRSLSDDNDDADDVDKILKSLEDLGISCLLTQKGRVIEKNDIHDWIQNTNKHLEIAKFGDIIPLYQILKEDQRSKINYILKNNICVIMTGITDLTNLNNDDNEYNKRVDFELPLESEDYQVFGSIVFKDNSELKRLEEIYVNFGLYDFNGFYAVIKNEKKGIDITKCCILWIIIGNPSKLSIFSPSNREFQVNCFKESVKLQPDKLNYTIDTLFTLHEGYTVFAHANHSTNYGYSNVIKLVKWKEKSIDIQIESTYKIESNTNSSNLSDDDINHLENTEIDLHISILTNYDKNLKIDNYEERKCPLNLIGYILSKENFSDEDDINEIPDNKNIKNGKLFNSIFHHIY